MNSFPILFVIALIAVISGYGAYHFWLLYKTATPFEPPTTPIPVVQRVPATPARPGAHRRASTPEHTLPPWQTRAAATRRPFRSSMDSNHHVIQSPRHAMETDPVFLAGTVDNTAMFPAVEGGAA